MGGTILVTDGPYGSVTGCTGATGCVEHERPFTEILPLVLSDTFYEWYEATNEVINAVNPIKVYDITLRGGLVETYNQGGDLHVEIDTGEGLRVWPPDPVTGTELTKECHDGKLRLDYFGLPEAHPTGAFEPFEDNATGPPVQDNDLYAIERMEPYQGVFPTDIAGGFYKVKAENILPYTVAGDHRFTGKIIFENPVTDVSSTKVVIDDKNIELGASPYMMMTVELVTGASSLSDMTLKLLANQGVSHDYDGDGLYYEDTPPSSITGEIFSQVQEFFDTGVSDLTSITGTETAKATLLWATAVTGSSASPQALCKLRAYNDIPFNTTENVVTDRSGLTLKIVSIEGQAGWDTDADGGGITLLSTDGNKTITWKDSYDAWEINQNLRIDSSYAILTPFNITDDSQGTVVTDSSRWKVDQYLTGDTLPLPVNCPSCVKLTDSDLGLLHFSYVTAAGDETPTLSLLPCGGIYIHNIECSPQFSTGSSPCSVVVGNKYGLIDASWTERMFYPTTKSFSVGDVVRIIDGTSTLTGAMADTADNAEVLGIVAELISAGPTPCGTKEQGVIVAYGGEIDWTDGMAGISGPLTRGAIYYLSPTNGGELQYTEPFDIAEVRKPMILATAHDKALIVNYEGVVNGDYFDENPVTRLTELRDVTLANVTGGQVLYYDGDAKEWVNESMHTALGSSAVKTLVTGGISGGTAQYVTLTFPNAYPYTSLPSNSIFVMRGTMATYDHGSPSDAIAGHAVTGTTGVSYPVTGGPKHEVSPFVGAFFNLDDHATTGNMDGSGADANYITGSLNIGVQGKSNTRHAFMDWTTGADAPADWDQIGSFSSIDFATGDVSLTFALQGESGTDWYYGITAWLEFLGDDKLPPT